MVRRIEWTHEAQKSKLDILQYWVNRNKSNVFAKKLNKLIYDSLKTIVKFPDLGRPTEISDIKYIIVRDYDIFYRELTDSIHVLLIWDSRRNPNSSKYKK